MRALPLPAKRSRFLTILSGCILVVLIGLIDFLTGYEVSVAFFYLLPIFLAAWYAGRDWGVGLSIVSCLAWFLADRIAGHAYSHPAFLYWNMLIRAGFFLTTALLVSALKRALEQEKELARYDSLTGLVNARYLAELVQMEIDRCQRFGHPFTLAYLDLDHFKPVNDRFGHSTGDQVLQVLAQEARAQLRRTDTAARLGGDEFVLLLPETDQTAARVVIDKLHTRLRAAMLANGWPVTFSIGVVACTAAPLSSEELLRQADALMYSVKTGGRDSIRYALYNG